MKAESLSYLIDHQNYMIRTFENSIALYGSYKSEQSLDFAKRQIEKTNASLDFHKGILLELKELKGN